MSDKKYGVFHLVSGVVVIAEFESLDNGNFKMIRPMDLVVQPTPQGLAASFVPHASMFGALPIKEERELPIEALMYLDEVPERLFKSYVEAVSKIQIATSLPASMSAGGSKLIV